MTTEREEQNSRVVFPTKCKDLETESKMEMLKMECMGVFREYVSKNCDKRGAQKSNLSPNEARGLKKLRKRVENGEIVILPTDKTEKFAVMGRETYEKAGLSHSRGDKEVGWGELSLAQREVNGHVSMLIKTFQIGRAWGHRDNDG